MPSETGRMIVILCDRMDRVYTFIPEVEYLCITQCKAAGEGMFIQIAFIYKKKIWFELFM